MSVKNKKFSLTKGETGKIMPFTIFGPENVGIFDAQGLANLTGKTVTFKMVKNNITYINGVACTIEADQTTNKSKGSFIFNAINANHPTGDYQGQFTILDGANVIFSPTESNGGYMSIKIKPAL